MRPLLLASLLALSACATTGQAPSTASRVQLPPFRAAPHMTELAQKRASARHSAAVARIASVEATPTELEEAAHQLESACKDGYRESCDFLATHATPVRATCPQVEISQEWFTSGANTETHVSCRISETGARGACTVLLDAPYGITEKHLQNRERCTYEPARIMGRPYPTFSIATQKLNVPVMQGAAGRGGRAMGDPLLEARRRIDKYPQSASAQRHLALTVGQRNPGSSEHLRALQRALQLLPADAALKAEAARVAIVQGRDAEAYALALAAVQELHWDRSAVQTYAAAAFVAGRCDEAVRAQQHALAMLDADGRESERPRMTERLGEYQKQCAGVAQPSTP